MNPIEWAKATVKNLGAARAYAITKTIGREKIGIDNDWTNPYFKFYSNAASWIKKHYPNDLEEKPVMKEFAHE